MPMTNFSLPCPNALACVLCRSSGGWHCVCELMGRLGATQLRCKCRVCGWQNKAIGPGPDRRQVRALRALVAI